MVLTAYVTPNIEWFSVLNGEYLQEVAGREELVKTLQTYYTQNQQTHWTVEQSMIVEQRVVVRERSAWRTAAGPGERVSLVVYELRDGRIARINYFLDAP
jgi:ketosteroid isomerase-like protein